MPLDHLTPSSIAQVLDYDPVRLSRVIGSWESPAMLESGPGFGASGRWSFLAARPRLSIEARGHAIRLQPDQGPSVDEIHHPLDRLGELLRHFDLARSDETPDPDAPPFQGGLIGHLGYDLAPLLERLPRRCAADMPFPDLRFGLYDTFVVLDHQRRRAELHAVDLLREGSARLENRLDVWSRAIETAHPSPPRPLALGPPVPDSSPDSYFQSVRRVLEYIAAGDIFQANLAQRFRATGPHDPLELYQTLKRRSPAPFAAYLEHRGEAIISSSPEWFYQTRGDRISTRPIKGTRPRSSDPAADAEQLAALRNSPKERAELAMIIDLERNDLGRVCRYGSIRVVDPWAIESYAQVHHQVATVEGRLRPDVGPMDVVRAMFPGGSITGAPKIRAMQIIDELEPCRRGVYTGAIGYFSRGGVSAFNIAIRTMLSAGGGVSFHVGGGIVADSDPNAEYEETLHKARGMMDVLEGLA